MRSGEYPSPGAENQQTMKLRWAIAATGRMAHDFASDLANRSHHEVVAVGSRSGERAAEFARLLDIDRAHGSYASLLDDGDFDVLYIATPHPQHYAITAAALERKIPVLVEKAFTSTYQGAQALVRLAEERDVFCMEAMWVRFQPSYEFVRQLVSRGEVGEIRSISATLGAHHPFDEASRLFNAKLGGGVTLDLGVYLASLAQDFLGAPTSVRATGHRFSNGTDATVITHLEYPGGRSANLTASLEADLPNQALIIGTRAVVELDLSYRYPDSPVRVTYPGKAPETHRFTISGGRGHYLEADEVRACLMETEPKVRGSLSLQRWRRKRSCRQPWNS